MRIVVERVLRVDDAHHADGLEAFHPAFVVVERDLLQVLDLGRDARGAPLVGVAHVAARRRLEQVGAVGVVELAEHAKQLVDARAAFRIARKRPRAAYERALHVEAGLQVAALLHLLGRVARHLEAQGLAFDFDELVAAGVVASEAFVVRFEAATAFSQEPLVRAAGARFVSSLQNGVALLAQILALGHAQDGAPGLVEVQQLVRVDGGNVYDAVAGFGDDAGDVGSVHGRAPCRCSIGLL
ncbi:hypothetical protein [Gordonibacter sp. 28C]|uniref:hypothetical protein n=1 Tax=Gordonibacter sp. 28C TaxID=2078569 RepID=UPI0011C0584F|nr:hypothetical protein [Gordonibacter sp. 28C]